MVHKTGAGQNDLLEGGTGFIAAVLVNLLALVLLMLNEDRLWVVRPLGMRTPSPYLFMLIPVLGWWGHMVCAERMRPAYIRLLGLLVWSMTGLHLVLVLV